MLTRQSHLQARVAKRSTLDGGRDIVFDDSSHERDLVSLDRVLLVHCLPL